MATTKVAAGAKTATASTKKTAGAKTATASTKKTLGAKTATASTKMTAGAKTATASTKKTLGAKNKAPVGPTLDRLHEIHPDAHCELDHETPFQLIVATVLSAQTTDVNVNKATPALFAKYEDAKALANADPADVEKLVSTLGFFRMKTKSIIGLAKKLVEEHGGEVPRSLAELVKLPGVGRKTANVVLGVAFNAPEGVVVDTHVQRISQRLGWTKNTDPIEIEQDLMKQIPRDRWDLTSHLLIFHGRRICFARKPNCEGCKVNDVCPSAFEAELVGRKPKRVRAV